MRDGDPQAIQKLVERYFRKLSEYADKKLSRRLRLSEDGEDIAILVLHAIAKNSQLGQFPNLQHREDLWLLMILLTQQQVIERHREAKEIGASGFAIQNMTDLLEKYNCSLDDFLENDSGRDRFFEIMDCWNELLKTFDDDRSRDIARLKLQGFSNREIASILSLVPKTVDRKVQHIMQRWQDFFSNHFTTPND
jgi:DNA-directed RNA polymerase specialized sigma24 family protein